MPAAIESARNAEWVNQRAAAAIIRRAPSVIVRLALIGEIRTESLPGRPLRYNRADVERIARQSQTAEG